MSLRAAPYVYVPAHMPAPEVGYVINCLTLGKINKKTRLQDINLKSRKGFSNKTRSNSEWFSFIINKANTKNFLVSQTHIR